MGVLRGGGIPSHVSPERWNAQMVCRVGRDVRNLSLQKADQAMACEIQCAGVGEKCRIFEADHKLFAAPVSFPFSQDGKFSAADGWQSGSRSYPTQAKNALKIKKEVDVSAEGA